MKHLKKRFSLPDNIFKIHWDMIKTAAAAAFYSFEPFLYHMRVQISFHFRFLCLGWPGSNPMGPNTCPNSGLRPTAKKIFSRIECCFMICKLAQTQSLKSIVPYHLQYPPIHNFSEPIFGFISLVILLLMVVNPSQIVWA